MKQSFIYIFPAVIVTLLISYCSSPTTEVSEVKQEIEEVEKLSSYVDPLFLRQVESHGSVSTGAYLPFGMVRPAPINHCFSYSDNKREEDCVFTGFRQTQVDNNDILSDFLIVPGIIKKQELEADNKVRWSRSEEGKAGYHALQLHNPDLSVEITATKRVAFYKFKSQPEDNFFFFIDPGVDFTNDLPVLSHLTVINDSTIAGYRLSSPSTLRSSELERKIYFVIQFSKKWQDYNFFRKDLDIGRPKTMRSKKSSAKITFDSLGNDALFMKVAVSTASVDGAQNNLLQEVPHWDFDLVRKAAEGVWEQELNRVSIKVKDSLQKKVFYSSLYKVMQQPRLISDVDGSYSDFTGEVQTTEGQYDRYHRFDLKESYKNTYPLYALFYKDRVNDFIRSFLAHYKETGALPESRYTARSDMESFGAVSVIADAYLKGIGDFDVNLAYKAIKETLENHPYAKLVSKYNFIPSDYFPDNSFENSLEFAQAFKAASLMAEAMGYKKDYKDFISSSELYTQNFDSLTLTMRPKNIKGDWADNIDELDFESDSVGLLDWEKTWAVRHDVEGLIKLMNGKENFVAMLDSFLHVQSKELAIIDSLSASDTTLRHMHAQYSEENSHIPFLYTYAGKSWKTQEMLRSMMDSIFASLDSKGRYSYKDDFQPAWLIFNMLGLYPLSPVGNKYILGSPVIDGAVLSVSNKQPFSIKVNNQSNQKHFVKLLSLNRSSQQKDFISYKEMFQGGEVILEMVQEPNKINSDKKLELLSDSLQNRVATF
ncbi:GH92 family glycosyl hydrolase [Chondrinema litorale]|uniref:GH92 family glycosyl hydrolase n=1 Tax=Chondrinema litorale TaxID=2994555 RepID=UPI002542E6F9|nr:GH92 family glycosyl hydrolase [Chondrinema litorale]UZR93378.1 GH92 family glycosyl hydrolase [Chondrinema litorale]